MSEHEDKHTDPQEDECELGNGGGDGDRSDEDEDENDDTSGDDAFDDQSLCKTRAPT